MRVLLYVVYERVLLMVNQKIVDELQTPAAHGIDGVIRTYTNPGGAPKADALDAIVANADIMNQKGIDVYRDSISPDEYFTVLNATSLQALSAAERDDYQAFIVPMLNGSIQSPNVLLKDLINDVTFKGTSAEDIDVREKYEALIREDKSVAQILGVNVRAGDIEQAMFQLGWII